MENVKKNFYHVKCYVPAAQQALATAGRMRIIGVVASTLHLAAQAVLDKYPANEIEEITVQGFVNIITE